MKGVFQIISSIHPGGAENIAFSISEYMKQHNTDFNPVIFEIYKTDTDYSFQLKKKLKEQGIEFHTLGARNKYLSLLIAPFVLTKYIRKLKPVIIHSHTDLPDFVLAMTIKLASKIKFTVIRTIHNTELWPIHFTLGKITEKAFNNDMIIAVSDAALTAYNHLRSRYKLQPSKYQHIIYNGIRIPASSPFPFAFDHTKINIAFAGRLELQKGIDILISLLDICSEKIKSAVVFHIIGDGTYKKQVENACKKYNYCVYHGVVPDLSNKLSSFSYLIMPSRHEGLVLLSLEASFAKVPVIASDIPGLKETLPAEWPLLVHSLNPSSFLQLLEKIIGQEINTVGLKEKSFHYASHKFSFERMGSEYCHLFKQLNFEP